MKERCIMKTLFSLLAFLLLALPVRACPPALLGAYNAYFGYGGGGGGLGYGMALDYGVDAYAAAPILDYSYAPAVSYVYSSAFLPAYSAFGYGLGFNNFGYGFNRFGFNRFGFRRGVFVGGGGVNVRVGRGFGRGRTVVRIR